MASQPGGMYADFSGRTNPAFSEYADQLENNIDDGTYREDGSFGDGKSRSLSDYGKNKDGHSRPVSADEVSYGMRDDLKPKSPTSHLHHPAAIEMPDRSVRNREQNDNDGSPSEQKEHWCSNIDSCLCLGYFFALFCFILGFNTSNLATLPYPVIGNLVDWDKTKITKVWSNGVLLILACWGLAFLRKTFVLIVRFWTCPCGQTNNSTLSAPTQYRRISSSNIFTSKSDCILMCALPIAFYHGVFAFMIGWSTNFKLGYKIPEDEFFYSGLTLMVLSEIMLITLAILEKIWPHTGKGVHVYGIKSVLEIFSWTGFCILTFTLPASVWLLTRIAVEFYKVHNVYYK